MTKGGITDITKVTHVEGRVLGHSEDAGTGKPYMLSLVGRRVIRLFRNRGDTFQAA
jgi:hypothetical protein